MPVRDLTQASMPWSLAEEFDAAISSSLLRDGSLYVLPRAETEQAMAKLTTPRLDSKLNDLISLFAPAEFLVELELVRHREAPIADRSKLPIHMQDEAASVIESQMRVRLYDLRRKEGQTEPKLLLQEIVDIDHFVDKNKTATNYARDGVGTKAYPKTPLGIAHAKLSAEVSERIEHYVAIAKSRPDSQ
jgi:hypothetical protein